MGRRKSVKVIDRKISLLEAQAARTKARYDRQLKEITELKAEKESLMAEEILTAFKSSGKSYKELMIFLGR